MTYYGYASRFQSRDKAMGVFIRSLRKQPHVLDAWDSTLWTVMVEKGIIHRDGTITFVFKNGREISVLSADAELQI